MTLQEFLTAVSLRRLSVGLKIDLRHNIIRADGAKLLADALKSGHCPAGLQIDLSFNNIRADGTKYLADALKSGRCPAGLQIDLRFNNIGADGAKHVADALKSGNCPAGLQINLGYNNIGADGAKHVADALKSGNCPAGLQINLRFNYIDADGAKDLADALKSGNCPAGLQIDLGYSNIRADGTKDLADALKSGNCPVGLQITLRRNKISDDGVKHLADALKSGNCPAGLRINLWNNNIGADGAKHLADALKSGNCPAGLQIDLRYNNIGADGAKHLANALKSGRCPTDLQINLAGNNIGADGAKDLGVTALFIAAATGQLTVIQYLVDEKGVSLTEKNKYGNTALLRAAANGQLTVIQYLVDEKGVSLTEKNKNGDTVFTLAKNNNQKTILLWLNFYQQLVESKEPALLTQSAPLEQIISYNEKDKSALREAALLTLRHFNAYNLFNTHTTTFSTWITEFNQLQLKRLWQPALQLGLAKHSKKLYAIGQALLKEQPKIELKNCHLNQRIIASLIPVIQENPVNALILNQVTFTPKGWSELLSLLKLDAIKNTLQRFELSDSRLTQRNLVELAPRLKAIATLTTCNLDRNQLNKKVLKRLLDTFSTHAHLTSLSLRHNLIEWSDLITYIADVEQQALKMKGVIKKITLGGNYFGSEKADSSMRLVLELFLRITDLPLNAFLNSHWRGIEKKEDSEDFEFRLSINNQEKLFTMRWQDELRLESLRKANGASVLSQVFKSLKKGFSPYLLHHPADKTKKFSDFDESDRPLLCKALLINHPNAPLKYRLATHPIFHTERSLSSQSLLFPQHKISADNWLVYVLAKKTRHRHNQRTWYVSV